MTIADAASADVARVHRNAGQIPDTQAAPAAGARLAAPVRRAGVRFVHAGLAWAISLAAAAAWLQRAAAGDPLAAPLADVLPIAIAAAAFPISLNLFDVFRVRVRRAVPERLARVFAGAMLAAGLAAAAAHATGSDAAGPARLAPLLAGLSGALLALDLAVWAAVRRWARHGRLARRIAIVGATADALKYVENAEREGAVRVVAVFEDREARRPGTVAGAPVLGGLDALLAWPDLPRLDGIVVALPAANPARIRAVLERLRPLPNPVSILLDCDDRPGARGAWVKRPAPALAHLSDETRHDARAAAVRAQDLVLGSLILIPLLPAMALIGLAVRLDSRGPVFFRQARHGFNNDVFDVFKFRTMRPDDGAPVEQVVAGDPRVTRVGKFLRKTSLDELPQIFNVLRGEMSLVGPRPHAVGMRTGDVETPRLVFDYAHRHRVKPGMTGWAQVRGSRGPLHTADEVRERVRLDLEYVERRSLWLDLWIMLRTIPCLLGDSRNVR